MSKIYSYIVWASKHTKLKVRARSTAGARKRAWEMIAGGFTHGWSRKGFLLNAKVERID